MKNLSEKKLDKLLKIKTAGVRSSKTKQNYRYEATPYNDLKLIFEKIKLKSDDHFLDFGSGKGRVCFYVHYLFNSFVYGVEANPLTFDDAIQNTKSYYSNKQNDQKVTFFLTRAEDYQITSQQNIFFFFNPFSLVVFKKVITNIKKSLKVFPRKIIIILAYPIVEYVSYILEHTTFIVKDYIDAKDKTEKHNKFLILTNNLKKIP